MEIGLVQGIELEIEQNLPTFSNRIDLHENLGTGSTYPPLKNLYQADGHSSLFRAENYPFSTKPIKLYIKA